VGKIKNVKNVFYIYGTKQVLVLVGCGAVYTDGTMTARRAAAAAAAAAAVMASERQVTSHY